MTKPKKRTLLEVFSDDNFPPCKFCGRIVLAGICCNEALEQSKKELAKLEKKK